MAPSPFRLWRAAAIIAGVAIVATIGLARLDDGPVLLRSTVSDQPLVFVRRETRLLDRPVEPYRISPPYEIVDGLTFGPDKAVKTRLAGLTGPARDAVCYDRDGKPWACGLQARAALNNATRTLDLSCVPVGGTTAVAVTSRCTGGEADIGLILVAAGFARPVDDDPVAQQAESEARQAELGLWNGGWTVRSASR